MDLCDNTSCHQSSTLLHIMSQARSCCYQDKNSRNTDPAHKVAATMVKMDCAVFAAGHVIKAQASVSLASAGARQEGKGSLAAK